MKKLTIVFFLVFMFLLVPASTISANADYLSYEKLVMSSGKIISEWTKDEMNDHLTKVNKRRFSGWRIFEVNKNVRVTYDTETLFSYYNDGYTPIDYTYTHKASTSAKVSISASGSIGLNITQTKKEFKNGLTSSVKLDVSATINREVEEKYEIKLKVDPGTQVDLYIHGEGRITNGVACRYVFWIKMQNGAYEIFTVTTQYYRLEKKKI
ncbi:hypothetical protein LJC17_03545 [Acholeplasma sp. OttesenSCG-928-E16]|nr:hypothetical protein [Acholeplasma sp. OttesenSCG-928-E16]